MSQPEQLGRKRSRSKCDDGGCDFMPLSKRINNLHLDRPTDGQCPAFGDEQNGLCLQSSTFENDSHWGPGGQQEPTFHGGQRQISQSPIHPDNQTVTSNNVTWMSDQVMAQYAPVLNPTDNPHYYESNKLLFALFMERLQRISPL